MSRLQPRRLRGRGRGARTAAPTRRIELGDVRHRDRARAGAWAWCSATRGASTPPHYEFARALPLARSAPRGRPGPPASIANIANLHRKRAVATRGRLRGARRCTSARKPSARRRACAPPGRRRRATSRSRSTRSPSSGCAHALARRPASRTRAAARLDRAGPRRRAAPRRSSGCCASWAALRSPRATSRRARRLHRGARDRPRAAPLAQDRRAPARRSPGSTRSRRRGRRTLVARARRRGEPPHFEIASLQTRRQLREVLAQGDR